MARKKECDQCGGEIKKNDKYVILSTISPKLKQEHFFHFTCFKKNHEAKVQAKARAIVQKMQGQALNLLGSIQQGMGDLAGGEQMQKLLNIDLNKEIPNLNNAEISVNFKDGKKNKKRKKV